MLRVGRRGRLVVIDVSWRFASMTGVDGVLRFDGCVRYV